MVKGRRILSAEYRLPLLAKTDPPCGSATAAAFYERHTETDRRDATRQSTFDCTKFHKLLQRNGITLLLLLRLFYVFSFHCFVALVMTDVVVCVLLFCRAL